MPEIQATTAAPEAPGNESDGLIYFDRSGNFAGCSAAMAQLAGSEAALRNALAEASWPREFAAGGERTAVFKPALSIPVRQRRAARVQCTRTAAGFVAAVRLEPAAPRELLFEIFSARLAERRAISKYLHGGLTQDLVALSLSLGGLRPCAGDRLTEAIAQVDRCCRGVRALSYVLAPPAFLDSGFIQTIRWYGEVLQSDTGIAFSIDAAPLSADPPPDIKDLFFAGLQHVSAAAIRSAREASVRVRVDLFGATLSIRVDCRRRPGGPVAEPVAECPLIRERARSLGGRSRFTAGALHCRLEISIPWRPAAAPGGHAGS